MSTAEQSSPKTNPEMNRTLKRIKQTFKRLKLRPDWTVSPVQVETAAQHYIPDILKVPPITVKIKSKEYILERIYIIKPHSWPFTEPISIKDYNKKLPIVKQPILSFSKEYCECKTIAVVFLVLAWPCEADSKIF